MSKAKDYRAQAVPDEMPHAPVDDSVKQPKFGTGRQLEEGGDIPRVVDQLDRAPANTGTYRFKVRCDNYLAMPLRYILARTEDEARKCYLDSVGKPTHPKKESPENLPVPYLVVKQLAD